MTVSHRSATRVTRSKAATPEPSRSSRHKRRSSSPPDEESNTCIDEDFGQYPGLTVKALLKPQYQSFFDVPFFRQLLGDQMMGTASSHPQEPLLMVIGNSDGTGDGAMVAADVQRLARQYCSEGVPVDFQEYSGASHEDVGALFEPQTAIFLQGRFADLPPISNC